MRFLQALCKTECSGHALSISVLSQNSVQTLTGKVLGNIWEVFDVRASCECVLALQTLPRLYKQLIIFNLNAAKYSDIVV